MLPSRMSGNDIPEGDEGTERTELKVKGAEHSDPIGVEVLRHACKAAISPGPAFHVGGLNFALCRTARTIRIGKLVGRTTCIAFMLPVSSFPVDCVVLFASTKKPKGFATGGLFKGNRATVRLRSVFLEIWTGARSLDREHV